MSDKNKKGELTTPKKFIQQKLVGNMVQRNALEKVTKLKDKLTLYRNVFYNFHSSDEEYGIYFNEYEIEYLITLLSEAGK